MGRRLIVKSDWRKRKRRTRLAKANGFNHYHKYKEYVKYTVKLDGMMKRCSRDEKPSLSINFQPFMPEYDNTIVQMTISDFINKFMENMVKETWCTETYCDDGEVIGLLSSV